MSKQCELCNRQVSAPRSYIYTFFVFASLVLAVLVFAGVGTLRGALVHLEKTASLSNSSSSTESAPESSLRADQRCDFPLVYNKPHKTASTKIQGDIFDWVKKTNRTGYKCSPFINQATMQMRECIPEDHSGCAVIATHVVMSPTMTSILESKIGKFFLLTSTRNPHDRILSFYLQMRGMTAQKAKGDLDGLKNWLKEYNPWELYNYQTGGNKVGACPLNDDEKLLIPDLVNRPDMVVDMDLFNASQSILKWKGLFPLSEKQTNVRSSKDLTLDKETEDLIEKAACVEEEMHRLYRLRMASLYEKATGKGCLSDSRHPTTCF